MPRFQAIAILLFLCASASRADDWPQWLGPKRDGVWREKGIVKKLPKDGPPVLWRHPVAEGYAGPAVANGKVYVADWTRDPNSKRPRSAFDVAQQPGTERVLCLDEKTGKEIWSHSYDCPYRVSYAAGPRCTPMVNEGKVYTLGAMGNLFCLDADSGKVIWSKDFPKDYGSKAPLWGFAGHPLIDGERLICVVGGKRKNTMVAAFDKDSGKELWTSLDTLDATHGPGYCTPVIAEVGKTRQVIVWYPEAVSGLDPKTGKELWTQPFQLKAGMAIATPRVYDDRVFLTAFYNGPMMLQLSQDKPGARVLWKARDGVTERKTEGLHAVMCTPFLKDGFIYGICSYGQMRCLKITSGERIWEDLHATGGKEERWGNAFLVQHEDQVFIFNEHGELIIAVLSPDGYEEISRAKILEPTNPLVNRPVVWSHPAFANKHVYARNDKEVVCVDLSEK
jgi:outer membrane protein assembly factor BamB